MALRELEDGIRQLQLRLAEQQPLINELQGAVGEWETFTPTLTNFTLGNGQVIARYKRIGKTVHFHVRISFGSTSALSGSLVMTLPVEAVNSWCVGASVYFLDNGTQWVAGAFHQGSPTQITIRAVNASATYATIPALSATVPFTWTTSDYIDVGGTYEAA